LVKQLQIVFVQLVLLLQNNHVHENVQLKLIFSKKNKNKPIKLNINQITPEIPHVVVQVISIVQRRQV
jgi:hypothetical protein